MLMIVNLLMIVKLLNVISVNKLFKVVNWFQASSLGIHLMAWTYVVMFSWFSGPVLRRVQRGRPRPPHHQRRGRDREVVAEPSALPQHRVQPGQRHAGPRTGRSTGTHPRCTDTPVPTHPGESRPTQPNPNTHLQGAPLYHLITHLVQVG